MAGSEFIVLYDLAKDDSFPPYGESRSEMLISGPDARLIVFWEVNGGADEARLMFRFKRATQVVRSAFPGVGDRSLACSPTSLGRLVQITDSAMAKQWTAYWSQHKMPRILHYQIVLTEANEKYDVLAENVDVEKIPPPIA